MIIILYFLFTVYTSSDKIGSPSEMYSLLQTAAKQRPVAGNQDGSYLTLKSNFALVFGIIQLCSGSGTVFLDQAYWQRAIASRPTTAVRAYILGGLAWFAIPFGFATTLGLSAVALTGKPYFPTYPNIPSSADIQAGLASSYAASALLGTGGAVALLLVLFMAVTSCASAELIAVSSILTFDVYKEYVKPTATPANLIFVAHVMIGVFGLTMAVVSCIWQAIGISLGWLFLVMGLIIGGAVFPAAFAITWKKQTKWGAISGALSGLVAGLIGWLVEAKVYYGELTVASTGMEYPTLAGNLAAILTGLIVTVCVSLVKPDDFDWEITRSINAENRDIVGKPAETATGATTPAVDEKAIEKAELPDDGNPNNNSDLPTVQDEEKEMQTDLQLEEEPSKLRGAFRLACIASFVLTFIMDFLIPIPMFLSHYVFSQGFFVAWVVITFIWVFASAAISIILPIFETAGFFKELFTDVRMDLSGKRARRGSAW